MYADNYLQLIITNIVYVTKGEYKRLYIYLSIVMPTCISNYEMGTCGYFKYFKIGAR